MHIHHRKDYDEQKADVVVSASSGVAIVWWCGNRKTPSGKCAKLHTVAASNNRVHPTRPLSSSPLARTIYCSPGSQAVLEGWSLHQDHSVIACSRHIYIVFFFAHIPFVVNRAFQRNASGVVAIVVKRLPLKWKVGCSIYGQWVNRRSAPWERSVHFSLGLPDAFFKIPAILSTVPELSCVVIRKQHRENRETITIVNQQYFFRILAGSLHFGVCDVKISPRIASTAANKLHLRNCPDKIHY